MPSLMECEGEDTEGLKCDNFDGDKTKRSYMELVDALVDRAREWREAEIHEFETDSRKEREERHYTTNSALCQIRKAVFDLFPHLSNDALSQRTHMFDPIYNGADECECGLLQSAPVHSTATEVQP